MKIRNILEFIKEPLLVLLAGLFIIQFVGAQTVVPSGSMLPTIQLNDRLIISRIPTYYRAPEVGEIVVFWEDETNMIKRVIAGPGDTIDLIDGDVYVNGDYLEEDYVNDQHITYPMGTDITYPYTVPEAHYFVLGDNRGNSKDSRYYGPISDTALRAIGAYRIWPWEYKGVLE